MTTAATSTQPEGLTPVQRWLRELEAGKKYLEKFHKKGTAVVEAYLDEDESKEREGQTRWSLFWSNVTMQLAMLYGNIPRVDVSRRFADSEDDPGRVAGEMMERLLNTDIERDSDTTATALGYALWDWRVPGAGFARLRYVMEEAPVEGVPQVQDEETGELVQPTQVSREDVEVDYVHWKDVCWSPSRVWHEARWIAFAADISRETAKERFPKHGDRLPVYPKKKEGDEQKEEPWDRVRVWEIWSKEKRCVYWVCEGYSELLDEKEDPLGLEGFWPCPRPLFANLTTTKLIPKADYLMAQDLYVSINNLSTRIELLQQAVKVTGFYDRANGNEMAQVFDNTTGNRLYPVDKWAAFQERGGVKGSIDFLPLKEVVEAIMVLQARREAEVEALYQITGQSDLMRGQATTAGASATEQAVKARFGSVRIKAMQDEFARFTTDIQKLKAEIISKHFRPETILARSNAQFAFKKEKPGVVQAAVQLIKSRMSDYRVQVKTDSLSYTDFAALKEEKTEVLGALSTFFQGVAPIAEAVPGSMPFLLQLLQSVVAGMRGSATMEGVIDQAIEAAEQAQQQQAANPQPQDPALQVEQMKAQTAQMKVAGDMQKEQMKLQGDLTRIQAESAANAAKERVQREENVKEQGQKLMIQNALKPPEPVGGGRQQ